MKKFTYIFLLLFSIIGFSQSVQEIVNEIEKINEYHHEYVGFSLGENHKNFQTLKSKASIEELVKLTEHKNPVVIAYSANALFDKKYQKADEVFAKILKNDSIVEEISGDLWSESRISNIVYHHYWNSVNINDRETDKMLIKLDSLSLHNDDTHWLILLRAFNNRLYTKDYQPQIEYLAFKKLNKDAIFYLSNWYKADYKNQIEQTLLSYLERTDFQEVGVSYYYDIVAEILKFRNFKNDERIINKMKKDTFWLRRESSFVSLLEKYGNYEFYEQYQKKIIEKLQKKNQDKE